MLGLMTKKKHEKILSDKLTEQHNEMVSLFWACNKPLTFCEEAISKWEGHAIGARKALMAIKFYLIEVKMYLNKI